MQSRTLTGSTHFFMHFWNIYYSNEEVTNLN